MDRLCTMARWDQYTALKDIVPGTRFIPFKTPYHSAVRGELFTPSVLLDRVSGLGFVVNLVKTDRYYNPKIFSKRNIGFFHQKLEGHGSLPSDNEVKRIFEEIGKYVSCTTDATKLIGVHCTHGVNRTGYIICRYMIEKLGKQPDEALQLFEEGRGHRIDRHEYVDNLLGLRPVHIFTLFVVDHLKFVF